MAIQIPWLEQPGCRWVLELVVRAQTGDGRKAQDKMLHLLHTTATKQEGKESWACAEVAVCVCEE